MYVCIYVSYALLFVFGKHSRRLATFSVAAAAVAALLLLLLQCRSNMQPIKMFLFMYIFCRGRRSKLQVARAGGKVSCFDMNVSFAHLSSLINIFQRSRALCSRLKSRHSALLSRFLLARPYPMSHASCAMYNVHPMCHQYLHQ